VDDQEYCDFIFPGIVKRGPLTVAISTSGTSPAYAMQLRKELEEILPDRIGEILERMGELRGEVALRISDQKTRAYVYKKILAALIESENRLTNEELQEMIDRAADNWGSRHIKK
jgi:precorrin-2 dehydrogenase/sirohydrochlorin ferrochelatase